MILVHPSSSGDSVIPWKSHLAETLRPLRHHSLVWSTLKTAPRQSWEPSRPSPQHPWESLLCSQLEQHPEPFCWSCSSLSPFWELQPSAVSTALNKNHPCPGQAPRAGFPLLWEQSCSTATSVLVTALLQTGLSFQLALFPLQTDAAPISGADLFSRSLAH